MKSICLLFTFLFASIIGYSQQCGNYKITISGTYNSNSPQYNMWTTEQGFGYASYEFPRTVNGLEAIESKVEEIFKANGYNKVPKGKFEGYIGNDVSDFYDKTQVHRSIQKGNTELSTAWTIGNQTLITIMASDGYDITVYGIYK